MKPRLLDLFCGAGGAAMGYHRAGFDVVGVDIAPQPNYPFAFQQADALEVLSELIDWFKLGAYDAIHASPPCEHYANVTSWRGNTADHPDLIGATRDLLYQTDLPWVMENVPEAPLRADFLLCGTGLGLRVRRHRSFETNWQPMSLVHPCLHRPDDYAFDHGAKQPESVYRAAMECDWMSVVESRDAIPPAYTEFIGSQLVQHVGAVAA